MTFLPQVIRVQHRGGFRLHLEFQDGLRGTLDLESWLQGPIFESIRSEAAFSQVRLEGGSVSWPNGADLAPESLYEAVRSAAA